MDENIVWHEHGVRKEDRERILGQKGVLVWFTGLSGSGKSTIAGDLQKKLLNENKLVYILDGDNVRHGLNSDLGFSPSEREENIRRVGEVGKLFVDAGVITMTSFISPYRKDRDNIRSKLSGDFIEVFVKCDLEKCKERDPKGLYKKALDGEIKDFTGVDAPYEEPENPEVVVDSGEEDVDSCVEKVYQYLVSKGIV